MGGRPSLSFLHITIMVATFQILYTTKVTQDLMGPPHPKVDDVAHDNSISHHCPTTISFTIY